MQPSKSVFFCRDIAPSSRWKRAGGLREGKFWPLAKGQNRGEPGRGAISGQAADLSPSRLSDALIGRAFGNHLLHLRDSTVMPGL